MGRKQSPIGLVTRSIEIPDNIQTGELMRKARKEAGLSLRELARRLKLSAPYAGDLELGRRNWTPELAARFADTLRELYQK